MDFLWPPFEEKGAYFLHVCFFNLHFSLSTYYIEKRRVLFHSWKHGQYKHLCIICKEYVVRVTPRVIRTHMDQLGALYKCKLYANFS